MDRRTIAGQESRSLDLTKTWCEDIEVVCMCKGLRNRCEDYSTDIATMRNVAETAVECEHGDLNVRMGRGHITNARLLVVRNSSG